MGLLGAIGAGIAGAADNVGAISMMQIKADIEEEKQQRLAESANLRARGNLDYAANLDLETDQKKFKQGLLNAPEVRAVKVADETAVGDARAGVEEGSKERIAKSALDFQTKNIGLIASNTKAIARAGHISSPADALATYQLDRAKLVGNAQDALAAATKAGDEVSIGASRKALAALTSKGEDPKDAATLMSASQAYARASSAEMDETEKKRLMDQSIRFGDLALEKMNVESGGKQSTQPTQAEIDGLKARAKNPAAVAAFNQRFGAGTADKILTPKSEAKLPTENETRRAAEEVTQKERLARIAEEQRARDARYEAKLKSERDVEKAKDDARKAEVAAFQKRGGVNPTSRWYPGK